MHPFSRRDSCWELCQLRFSVGPARHLRSSSLPLKSVKSSHTACTESNIVAEIPDIPACDQFGTIAAEADTSHPRLHQSMNIPLSDIKGVTDALLHEPLEDPSRDFSLIRDRAHPRYQRESKRLAKACSSRDADAALSVYFDSMLTRNRVAPMRFDTHMLLSLLATTGRSEDAFRVYRKMKEIGLKPSQATYSRLFRACAEDSSVWFREHEHLFRTNDAESPSAPAKQRLTSLVERAVSSEELFSQFGGPGLKRAHELWNRLHANRSKLTQVTYNTAILAFAKGGDLLGCLAILNALLDACKFSTPQNRISPDHFTLSALLSAIKPSLVKHALASSLHISHETVTQLDHFQLILDGWYRFIPHDGSTKLPLQLFITLLSAIKSLPSRAPSTTDFLTVLPPASSGPLVAPAAPRLESDNSEMRTLSNPSEVICTPTENSVSPRLIQLDWSNETLALRSPINLMLPSDYPLAVIYPRGKLTRWHRLVLFGGLLGFLDTVEGVYKSIPDSFLLTQLITLLPPPKKSAVSESEKWDVYERALIAWAGERALVLDMAFYNALIYRRTSVNVSADYVLQEAMRSGLTTDQITWGSLACGCHTLPEVKKMLKALSDASQPSTLASIPSQHPLTTTIRPSFRLVASFMFATRFHWDVKSYLLEILMGGTDGTICDGIEPDRRFVATLDLEVALFRELLNKGVVPADGSPVPASAETGGISVPAFAAAAFRRFIPVYKRWLHSSYRSPLPQTNLLVEPT